jgi:hypothetical protein
MYLRDGGECLVVSSSHNGDLATPTEAIHANAGRPGLLGPGSETQKFREAEVKATCVCKESLEPGFTAWNDSQRKKGLGRGEWSRLTLRRCWESA